MHAGPSTRPLLIAGLTGDGSDLLRELDQVESLVGNVPYGPLDQPLHAIERGHAIHIVGAI
jgi:hypothetical protein